MHEKKPKLRFKGFTDDWEQRKLGDCCREFKSGSFIPASDIEERGEYPVFGGNGLRGYTSEYNHDGEFALIGRQGALCGNMNYSKGKAYFTEHAVAVQANDSAGTKFMYYLLGKMKLGQYSDQSAQPGLAVGKLVTMNELFPTVEEQKKIGEMLTGLDNLIALHERKVNKLKNIKKSMLIKMFPVNGQKTPEIRFAGYTDDWEQRKVGDFLTESREHGHTGDIARKITVKLWGKGVFEKEVNGSSNTQYFIRHKSQFIYSKLDFLNCAFGVVPDELDGLETTADVPAFDCNGLNPQFMYYIAIQPQFYERNGLIADGSRKAKRIHADVFCEMPIVVPSLEEQNKIVDTLQQFDNLIALHERKVEKLKKIKLSMLSNMFV